MESVKFHTRRDFIKKSSMAIASSVLFPLCKSNNENNKGIVIEPTPLFDLSPYLFMQFMEPLGTTDGSIAAAWHFKENKWREDVVEITKNLSPTMMRWGGCFSSYYRWKEAIGPRNKRIPMYNLRWGGIDTNQIGTEEFVNFCHQVGAEPMFCVNFESDGRSKWMIDPEGKNRKGTAEEAREWVDYCNNPSNILRKMHGHEQPLNVPFWQIGNETSYDKKGYECNMAIKRTIAFSKSMRKADPHINLIVWGDSGWAGKMLEGAGEHIDYIAFHHMFNPDRGVENSPLKGIEYRKDFARTWEHLMNAYKVHENKINMLREQVSGLNKPLALTECHFSLPGRNRCEVLSTWAAGVANARLLNVHERNGDLLKIATLADFCGTRWMVNAIMIPVPYSKYNKAYMMPVAKVMELYRKHSGEKAIKVSSTPDYLDVTASRSNNTIYIHVINTNRSRSIECNFSIISEKIKGGKVFELSADPEHEIIEREPDILIIKEKSININKRWTFPTASVSAVELYI